MRTLTPIALTFLVASCAPAETLETGRTHVDDGSDDAPAAETGAAGPSSTLVSKPAKCALPRGYNRVAAGDLLDDPAAWAGEEVGVEGNVVVETLFTTVVCPPVATCCNKIGKRQYLAEPHAPNARILLTGLGCGVFDCECNVLPEGPALVWGTAAEGYRGAEIAVDGVCAEAPWRKGPPGLP